MKTTQEFVESLHQLKRELYVLGDKVENATEHPILRPSLNALAKTYEMAHDPRYTELDGRVIFSGENTSQGFGDRAARGYVELGMQSLSLPGCDELRRRMFEQIANMNRKLGG